MEKFHCSINHITAFPFENHLQAVKKLVKGPQNPISQEYSRLSERQQQNMYKHQKVLQPYVSACSKVSMFFLPFTNEFCMIQRQRRRDGMYDVVLEFPASVTRDYFDEPYESKRLGIYLVKNLDHVWATPRVMAKHDLMHKVCYSLWKMVMY